MACATSNKTDCLGLRVSSEGPPLNDSAAVAGNLLGARALNEVPQQVSNGIQGVRPEMAYRNFP
jgi:hypothetical protein